MVETCRILLYTFHIILLVLVYYSNYSLFGSCMFAYILICDLCLIFLTYMHMCELFLKCFKYMNLSDLAFNFLDIYECV
jgi:hypothetical protein